MSLINDALKRASARASAPANPDLPAGIPVLQPAPDQKRGSALPILVLVVLAAVLVAAFFMMRGKPAETQAKGPPQPSAPQPAAAKSETAAPAPGAGAGLANSLKQAAAVADKVSDLNKEGIAAAEAVAASAPAAPQPVTAPAPAPIATAAPVVAAQAPKPAEPPVFKLQAIFFRLNNPSAVINGKTIRKGDILDGAKILDIQRNAVELELSGARQTLSLR